jgi:hypothetical protein
MPALDTLRSSQQSSKGLGVRWTCDSDAAACGLRAWPMVASCGSSGGHRLGRAPHRDWRRLGPLLRRRGSVAGSHQRRCRCCRISSRPPDLPQPPEESPTGCPVARSLKSTRPGAPGLRQNRLGVPLPAGSDIIPHSNTSAAGVTTHLPVGHGDAPFCPESRSPRIAFRNRPHDRPPRRRPLCRVDHRG